MPPHRPHDARRIALLAAGVVVTGIIGNTLLRVGMSSTGPITSASPAAYIARFANPVIIGGVLALIARYIFQLSLLSWADLTYAIPITSVSYIVITAVGAWVLREEVSAAHWFGVVLILFGVIIVSRTKPLTGRAGAL